MTEPECSFHNAGPDTECVITTDVVDCDFFESADETNVAATDTLNVKGATDTLALGQSFDAWGYWTRSELLRTTDASGAGVPFSAPIALTGTPIGVGSSAQSPVLAGGGANVTIAVDGLYMICHELSGRANYGGGGPYFQRYSAGVNSVVASSHIPVDGNDVAITLCDIQYLLQGDVLTWMLQIEPPAFDPGDIGLCNTGLWNFQGAAPTSFLTPCRVYIGLIPGKIP